MNIQYDKRHGLKKDFNIGMLVRLKYCDSSKSDLNLLKRIEDVRFKIICVSKKRLVLSMVCFESDIKI